MFDAASVSSPDGGRGCFQQNEDYDGGADRWWETYAEIKEAAMQQ
jgi:hypothetical protein